MISVTEKDPSLETFSVRKPVYATQNKDDWVPEYAVDNQPCKNYFTILFLQGINPLEMLTWKWIFWRLSDVITT